MSAKIEILSKFYPSKEVQDIHYNRSGILPYKSWIEGFESINVQE